MIDLNKKIEMCLLADFYGNLLTQKQKQIFEMYWEKDFSLFEISQELNISRQAVHDSLNKAENTLQDIENKCGFISKYKETKLSMQQLINELDLSNNIQNNIANRIKIIISKL